MAKKVKPMANTRLELMYRDAGNFKVHGEAVLKGKIATSRLHRSGNHCTKVVSLLQNRLGCLL